MEPAPPNSTFFARLSTLAANVQRREAEEARLKQLAITRAETTLRNVIAPCLQVARDAFIPAGRDSFVMEVENIDKGAQNLAATLRIRKSGHESMLTFEYSLAANAFMLRKRTQVHAASVEERIAPDQVTLDFVERQVLAFLKEHFQIRD
jgi:hypothetical protein